MALHPKPRRKRHEQKAAAMAPIAHDPPDVMDDDALTPTLDEALARLGDRDRSAIAMRFFEDKSLREVGVAMGVSEEAAQKRVTRAVEKLRGFFARRGVRMPSDGMMNALARQSAALAPAALGPIIAAKALGAVTATGVGATAAATITHGAVKAMTLAQIKIAGMIAATAVVLAAGTAVVV